MSSLLLLRCPADPPVGFVEGRTFDLVGHTHTIGRDGDKCQIVIPHHTVSREHARITVQNGMYFVEDLKSRNRTYVNNHSAKPQVLVPLRTDDRIDICDFRFLFHNEADDGPGGKSTIEGIQGQIDLQEYLEVASSERLRALVDVSSALIKTLELEGLFSQIAETLFSAFRQADRCFVLIQDEAGKPLPRVVKTRRVGRDDTRFSRTIVRKTVESMRSYLSEDASVDASLGPSASISEVKIRSVMCVPLATSDGHSIGAIQLDTQEKTRKFTNDDLNLLSIVANLASVAIEKARMHEALVEVEVQRSENRTARKVQLSLLPQQLPVVHGYEFYSHYAPAQTVGGDYYDFITLPGGRIAVVLGDVSGKGVPAALLVAKLSSEVRFCLATEPDPARAMGLLSDQMIRGGLGELSGQFITMSIIILDPVAHQITAVNAGHDSPRIFVGKERSLRDVLSNDQIGFAVGWKAGDECHFQSVTLSVEPGDVVAVYTDGVSDSLNLAGERFGRTRIDHALAPSANDPLDALRPVRTGERLVYAVNAHGSGRAQFDDIAVISFGRLLPGMGTVESHITPQPPTTKTLRRES